MLFLVVLILLFGISQSAGATEVRVPETERKITIDDFANMQPRSELAGNFAKVEGFTQSVPTNGAPATQKTVVYLAYDKQNLYIVFACFDSEPEKIRAALTRRESFSDDEDWVEVYLDTYNDQRRAYVLSTNPYGIQWDSRYSEDTSHQPSFDALWYSEGRITDQGYLVWMAVPFKSLRFPTTSPQTWRTVFGRSIPRSNEYSSWPHVSREIQGTLSQSSLLTGLRDISPGRSIQFIPYTSFRSFRLLDTAASPPRFITDRSDPAAGVDAKVVLKDTFVFDMALNPDFSQVESDEPQVTVNQRFEVFFREKRPFFLENAQYFETPLNLVFTRRIADPELGGRLTGKYGPYTIGFLFTNDEAPGKQAPEDSVLANRDALFGIARISRDIFTQSSVGLLFTSRSFEDSTNTVAGFDTRLRLNDKWQASAQTVYSRTNLFTEDSLAGAAYHAKLSRFGRQFTYDLIYNDYSPDFVTLTGFIPRTDYRSIENLAKYYFRPEGSVLIAWGPELAVTYALDHNGTRLDRSIHPSLYVELQRRTFLGLHYFNDRERIRSIDFPGLDRDRDFATPKWRINLASSFWDSGTVELEHLRGKSINFVPPAGQLPERADITSVTASLILRAFQRVQLRNSYLFTALKTEADQSIFNDHIIRTRMNLQFTRKLSFRTILQYSATLVNSDLTRLENRRNFNADFLVTYLVNPWTALYVGYNGNRQNLLLQRDEEGTHVIRTRDALINDANQFFMKFSYLLRY